LFPDTKMVEILYDVAGKMVGDDPHLQHQIALYEMHRPSGNLARASSLLTKAAQTAYYDQTIKHSMAELKLRMVEKSKSELEKSKLLKEASDISKSLISTDTENSYGHHTIVKIGIRSLRDALEAMSSDVVIEKLVKDTERSLFDSLQQFPDDAYLLESESELAKLLNDDERAIKAMRKAFSANPRSAFIALSLADIEREAGNLDEALRIVKSALDVNASERRLHFAYAKLLMKKAGVSGEELAWHLQRAFTDGDSNYHAQLLYARQLFLNGQTEESRKVFKELGNVSMSPQARNRLMYKIDKERYRGKVVKLDTNYGFAQRDGVGDGIYFHRSNVSPTTWKNLAFGSSVEFSIAFSFKGVNATDLAILGTSFEKAAQMELPAASAE
jgi:tetratricopeptide (TPR) repeat protein